MLGMIMGKKLILPRWWCRWSNHWINRKQLRYGNSNCSRTYLLSGTLSDAARGSSDSLHMPDDVDMYGVTLYIKGTYQAPDSNQTIPFVAKTSLANGKNRDLFEPDNVDVPIHVGISETPVRVRIVRYLDTLFDGADFATMDSEALGKSVLWSILNHMQMVVLEGEIHNG